MTDQNYEKLHPYISRLLEKISAATSEIQHEFPELKDNDLFVVLYEASLATAGQVIGSAFISNPKINQVDMFRQAAKSLQTHTTRYQEFFLMTQEKKKEADQSREDVRQAASKRVDELKEQEEAGPSREELLKAMGEVG